MVNNYFGIYVQALLAKNSTKTLQKQLNAIKDLQVKVTPTFGKINKSQLTKINNELKQQLDSLTQEANKIDITPKVNQEKLNEAVKGYTLVKQSLSGVATQVKDTGESFNLFNNFASKATSSMDALLGIVGKVAIWGIATNAIYGTKKALEDLFDGYVEIEDKMISIQRVTENLDMSKIFDGSYNSSQKYGASLSDMLDSVEEIARSYNGLTEEEILATAEAGILASTIAEMDGEDAVQAIIAVSNAYDFAIENGQRLIDMANEVDNNFSVTASDITTAWEKSSATAKTFGVDIQNLTGYIAAISTVTQESGEVIGNGLKTIMSRITTMDGAINALKSANVDVFDDITGDARDVQDILEDLAGTWDDLSKTEQQNIGVKVAGRYQLTRFLALMNNWSIATDASATALNSEGSAARENEVYLESYTAKLTQLENAQKNLSETIYGSNISGWGKAWIDLKISLTDIATKFFEISDATTMLVGSIPVLIGFLAKTTNGYKLLTNALMFFTTQEKASAIATNVATNGLVKKRLATVLATAAEKLQAKATASKAAAELASITTGKASAAVAYTQAAGYTVAAGAASLLSKALFSIPGLAIVAVLGVLAKSLIDSANAANEAKQAMLEEATTVAENKKETSEYIEELERLNELKKHISADDYNSFAYSETEAETLEKLADIYTNISDELKSQNVSLEQKIKLIDEENKKLAETKKTEYDRLKNNFNYSANEVGLVNSDETSTVYSKHRDWDDLGGWEKVGRVVTLGWAFNGTNYDDFEDMADDYSKIYDAGQEYYRLIGDITTQDNEYINKIKEKGLADAKSVEDLEELSTVLETAQEAYKSTDSQGIQPYIDALKSLGYTDAQIIEVTSSMDEAIIDSSTQWALYKSTLDEASEGLTDFIDNAGNAIDDFFGVTENTTDAIDKMTSYINMFGTEATVTKDMADSLAQSFVFMGEQIFANGEDLLANRDKLSMINETLAISKSNEEAYAEAVANGTLYVAKGYEQEWETVRSSKIAELTVEKQTLENKIAIWQSVIDGEKTLAQASSELANVEQTNNQNKVKSLRDYWNDFKTWVKGIITGYKSVSDASKGDVDTAQKNFDALKLQLDNVNTSIKQWTDIKIVGTTVSDFKKITDTASTASEKTKTYFEKLKEAWEDYKNVIEGIDLELEILQEQFKNLEEGTDAWFNNINRQRQVIERQKSAILNYINVMKSQLNSDQVSASEKIELNNLIQEQTLEYEKLNTELTKLIDTEKDYYKTQIEKKLEIINNLEDERHDAVMDNIKSEREAFKKQIDEQIALLKKASSARTYEQDLNELQQNRLDILTQISRLEGDDSRLAQSKLVDLYDELKDVEKDIDNLNYDRNTELRENALDDLSESMDTYYDNLENIEDEKNSLITDAIDTANNNLDDINYSLGELISQLGSWDGIMSNFNGWAEGFNDLINTLPTSNIVSTAIPLNSSSTDEDGNQVTQVVLNITANSSEANDIATAAIDALIKAGVVTNKN